MTRSARDACGQRSIDHRFLDAALREAMKRAERAPDLPELSTRGLWIIEESPSQAHAIRALHSDALDADAIVLYGLGLSVPDAIGWAQSCVGSLAPPAEPTDPAEVVLRLAGAWHDAQRWDDSHETELVAEADRLASEIGTGEAVGWLARAVGRTGLPPELPALDRQLAVRFAVMSAVGLAAAQADEAEHGDYSERLRLCVALGPALLGALS